jgi:hypothetical protein
LFHQVSKVDIEFGYYVGAGGPGGSHRTVFREDGGKTRSWYCESFAEWLRRFVERGEAIFGESDGRPE